MLVGAFIYISVIRQIGVRNAPSSDESARTFGLPEAIVAAVLISLLLLNVIASSSRPAIQLSTRDLAANLALTIVVVLILVGFLQLRGFDLDSLGGLSKFGAVRAVSTGAVLLFFSYPLIIVADAIMQRVLGSGSSRQGIVELFNGSRTIEQRILIIILAVAIAPLAEEFVFRFFLYGVLRRYFGRMVGLTFNALLFAAVHAHLPSFAPLFVLGSCFTLAYEWSGSILVSMTMHSLFNSLTLIFLAFPELFQQ
jgi:membrane protease YdiL (CAAX protease family)